MTDYLTSAGVQHFTITIASGSLTGTATLLNAVGAGAVTLLGGVNPSVANDPAEDFAYLTKTSSTVITATRNTSTTGTIVINGCVIDGDTTNLIASVQYGTATIAANGTSGNATISAVTNANTALHCLGRSTAGGGYLSSLEECRVSLSGTTATATRPSSAITAIIVGFCAIELQGAALNQAVQNVSASSSSSVNSYTAALTSVNTANAISIFGGRTFAGGTSSPATAFLRGDITNGTTFTVSVNTAAATAKVLNATIVELAAGILFSAVQRGDTTLTAVASNTTSITAVTQANSGISWIGNTATATTVLNTAEGAVALTSGSVVTVTKNGAASNITGSWEVFELPAVSGGGATTSSGAATEAADVAAASALETFTGTSAVTEDVDVASAAAFTGTLSSAAATEDIDVAAAAALLTFASTASATEASDIAAGAGSLAFSATAAATESDDVAAGAGTSGSVATTGSGAVTEEGDSAAGVGHVVTAVATPQLAIASGRHHRQRGRYPTVKIDWYEEQEKKRAEFKDFVLRTVNPVEIEERPEIRPLVIDGILKEGYRGRPDYALEMLLLLAA